MMIFSGMKFSTGILQINYPFHDGRPNPYHGHYFVVGSIPETCWEEGRNGGAGGSKIFATEREAILAAIEGGAERIQGADCRIINSAEYQRMKP